MRAASASFSDVSRFSCVPGRVQDLQGLWHHHSCDSGNFVPQRPRWPQEDDGAMCVDLEWVQALPTGYV